VAGCSEHSKGSSCSVTKSGKKEAEWTSDTLVYYHSISRRRNPEYLNFNGTWL